MSRKNKAPKAESSHDAIPGNRSRNVDVATINATSFASPLAEVANERQILRRTEEDILNDYIVDRISRGGYLSCAAMMEDLGGMVNLRRFPLFRDWETVNRNVDSYIETYLNTNFVKSFIELEDIIVQNYRRWKKLTAEEIPSFISIGVGHLSAHPKVASVFQFPIGFSRDDVPSITVREIIKSMIEYLESNRQLLKLSHNDVPWKEHTASFHKFLRRRCQLPLDKPMGIIVDLETAVPVYKYVYHRENRLFEKSCRTKISETMETMRKTLSDSLNSLQPSSQGKDARATLDQLLKPIGVTLAEEYENLQNIFKNASLKSFAALENAILLHYFPSHVLNHIDGDTDNLYVDEDPQRSIRQLLMPVIALVLMMILKIFPGSPADINTISSGNQLYEKIVAILRERMNDDIPSECYESLRQLLDIIFESNFIGASMESSISTKTLFEKCFKYYFSRLRIEELTIAKPSGK